MIEGQTPIEIHRPKPSDRLISRDLERISSVQTPIFIIGSDFKVKATNPTLLEEYGISPQGIDNKSIFALMNLLSPIEKEGLQETDSVNSSGRRRWKKEVFGKTTHIAESHQDNPTRISETDEITIRTPNGKRKWIKLRPKFLMREILPQGPTNAVLDAVSNLLNRLSSRSESYDKFEVFMKSHILEKYGMQIEVIDLTDQKELELLAEASKHLTQALTTDEVLNRIRNSLATVVEHDTANIMLFDRDTKLRIRYKWGYRNGAIKELGHSREVSTEDKPLIQQMLSTKRPVHISDTVYEPQRYIQSRPESTTRSYAAAPIIIDGQVVGFINLNHAKADFFEQHESDLVQKFADHIAIALKQAKIHEETLILARTDQKTGLANHAYTREFLEREIIRSRRHHHPLSIIFVDVDKFKTFNDQFGQNEGDKRLREVANLLKEHVRNNIDLVGRWGGEENLIILPETDNSTALVLAERIRALAFNQGPKDRKIDSYIPGFTYSIGVHTLTGTEDIDQFIKAANNAERIAKKRGRNTIVNALTLDSNVRYSDEIRDESS